MLHYPKPRYFSQVGEDAFLDQHVFGGKRNGIFVDIGAHDGVTFSNTYFFEKERGWQGICIEPNPTVFTQLEQNRSAICLNAGIADKAGSMDFLQVEGAGNAEMFSGLMKKYDKRHLARIEKEVKQRQGSKQIITVETLLLPNLIKQYGITKIDYLTIDTEGGEFDILKTFDFTACHVDCITVEDLFGNTQLSRFMKKHGFKLLKKLDIDCVYVHETFQPKAWQKGIIGEFLRDFSW